MAAATATTMVAKAVYLWGQNHQRAVAVIVVGGDLDRLGVTFGADNMCTVQTGGIIPSLFLKPIRCRNNLRWSQLFPAEENGQEILL